MSDPAVPDKYLPTEQLPQVDVPEQSVEMADKERQEVGASLGVLSVSRDILVTMERLGLDIETLGVVKISNGFAYLTQQALVQCISKISQSVQAGKDPVEVATALAKLSNAMTNSVKASKAGVNRVSLVNEKPLIDIGFTPGRRIKIQRDDPSTSK